MLSARRSAVQIDWTLKAHGAQNPARHNAYDGYPGDTTVDIVGIDSYDMFPTSPTSAAFATQCNGPEVMRTLFAFARTHHTRASVGEWGVVTCRSGSSGGDEPAYVQGMYDAFAANRDVLADEAYFNDNTADDVCSSLYMPDDAPRAAALYHPLFGR